MLVPYIRSSSLGAYQYCQQQYFLTYVLGIPRSSSLKADKGTATHKVLEILACIKEQYQKTGNKNISYVDEAIGEININYEDLFKGIELTEDEIFTINKGRINKDIYLYPCQLKNGHIRYGREEIEKLIQRSCDYYSKRTGIWKKADYRDVGNFVWMSLEYDNGIVNPLNRKIVAPEKNFDITIDRPWADVEYVDNNEKTIKGKLAIKGTIDLITEVDDGVLEIIDWKGLPIDTLIPSPNGWTTMGELEVGDLVFDKDGNQVKVLGKSKVKEKECYEITFDDKTSVICDDEHLWYMNNGEVRSVTELKVDQVMPIAKPVKYNKKRLPIDPYVLGLWLGDGRNKNGEISSCDTELYESIEKAGYFVGEDINKTGTCPSKTVYGLATGLRKLNLLNNKHIPDIYLESSYNQRLELLRGLMDSDGNVNTKRKQCVFTSCNKKLSDDVKTLLLSLGQRPNQGNITRDTNFKKDVKVYPIHFRPIDKFNPFLLKRKKEKVDWTWGNGKSNIRRIISIEKIEKRKTQCIMVDSPSNTYLCTKNFIVTHNTGQRKDWATGEIKTFKKLCSDTQLMLYYYAASHIFPEYSDIMLSIFFVRDGGLFTIPFELDHLDYFEKILQERFEHIKANKLPTMVDPSQKDFRCKICDYSKYGNVCSKINKDLHQIGMDKVIDKYKVKDFNPNKYEAPGE